MDQRKEEEDDLLREPTEQRGKESPAEEEEGRSSDEESMAASSLFVHPCSLLQYLVRACACCLGMQEQDLFGGAKTRDAAPASADPSEEPEADAAGFYMQEVITRVWRVRRPRPPPPDKPREGSGGNGGHHN